MTGAPLRRSWSRRFTKTLRRLTHLAVFGDSPMLRRLVRGWLGPQLSAPAQTFDQDFYIAQAPAGPARERAARDPLLHYWLVGRWQGRLPSFPPAEVLTQSMAACDDRAPVLAIDHGRGGGSSHLLDLYLNELRAHGRSVLLPRRIGQETPLFVFPLPEVARALDLFADQAEVASLVRSLGIRHLIFNHLIDMPLDALARLRHFAEQVGATYEVLLHDYYFVCPRVDLIDSNGRYCGVAPAEICRSCLLKSGPVLAAVDPVLWREQARRLLSGATRVVAPSRDLAARMIVAFPEILIDVWEPEPDQGLPEVSNPPPLSPDEDMRVLVLGALNHSKGHGVILSLARELTRRRAPIRIALLGPAADATRLGRAGVRVHGRYDQQDVSRLLAEERPHVVFFPAIWPETWSFTLTEAMRSPAEIVAFDLGAIADRLRRLGRGRVLDYELHDSPTALADWLDQMRRAMIDPPIHEPPPPMGCEAPGTSGKEG